MPEEGMIDPATLEPAARQQLPILPILAPCPCGKIPEKLLIESNPNSKWGRVSADCCGEWYVEFRSGLHKTPEQIAAKAGEAWSEAPRIA